MNKVTTSCRISNRILNERKAFGQTAIEYNIIIGNFGLITEIIVNKYSQTLAWKVFKECIIIKEKTSSDYIIKKKTSR